MKLLFERKTTLFYILSAILLTTVLLIFYENNQKVIGSNMILMHSQDVINNSIEQTVIAEQAGFNAAWYAEHHFNNYSLSPSPLMTVAHAAAKTQTIRLGTAVCILPLYHPARFLAEVGFVDTVSNGR